MFRLRLRGIHSVTTRRRSRFAIEWMWTDINYSRQMNKCCRGGKNPQTASIHWMKAYQWPIEWSGCLSWTWMFQSDLMRCHAGKTVAIDTDSRMTLSTLWHREPGYRNVLQIVHPQPQTRNRQPACFVLFFRSFLLFFVFLLAKTKNERNWIAFSSGFNVVAVADVDARVAYVDTRRWTVNGELRRCAEQYSQMYS